MLVERSLRSFRERRKAAMNALGQSKLDTLLVPHMYQLDRMQNNRSTFLLNKDGTSPKEEVVMSRVLLARPCLRRQGINMAPGRMEALAVATKMSSQAVRTYGV
jgi:hypothetical protein